MISTTSTISVLLITSSEMLANILQEEKLAASSQDVNQTPSFAAESAETTTSEEKLGVTPNSVLDSSKSPTSEVKLQVLWHFFNYHGILFFEHNYCRKLKHNRVRSFHMKFTLPNLSTHASLPTPSCHLLHANIVQVPFQTMNELIETVVHIFINTVCHFKCVLQNVKDSRTSSPTLKSCKNSACHRTAVKHKKGDEDFCSSKCVVEYCRLVAIRLVKDNSNLKQLISICWF